MTRRYRTRESKTPCEKCKKYRKEQGGWFGMQGYTVIKEKACRWVFFWLKFKDETTRACKDFQAKEN